MFKLPFLNKTQSSGPKDQFLTLDIGTDSIKCLLIKYSEANTQTKFYITGSGKQILSPHHSRGGIIIDYEGVKEAVRLCIDQARAQGNALDVNSIIIGVSGELIVGLVTTVRVTRPNPVNPIDDKEITKIISKIEETAFLDASKEILERTGNSDMELDLINSNVETIRIDGSLVKNPIGMKGSKIELSLFTAFSPVFHLETLAKLAKDLNLNILSITSSLYTLTKYLNRTKEDNNMIIVDIGGITTELGIVFGGELISMKSLALGGNHFTKEISEYFSIPYNEAVNKKMAYSLGNLSPEETTQVRNALSDVLTLWVSGMEALFADFDGVKTYPSKIYLVGGTSALNDLYDLITHVPWDKTIPFKEPPTFERLSLNDLRVVADLTGKASGQDAIIPASLSEIYSQMEEVDY